MHRFALLTLGLVVALLVSCSDSPTTVPDQPMTAAAATGSHVTQAGNGNAWHGYHPPAFSHAETAAGVELCATWNDPWLTSRDDGIHADVAFFDFTFRWRAQGEDEWHEGSARNDEGTQTGCYNAGVLAPGDWEVAVSAMARHQYQAGPRNVTTTHHTEAGLSTIRVGGVAEPRFAVEVSPLAAEIQVGGQRQFMATVVDLDSGEPVADAAVTWSSGADGVATISADGLAMGITEGTAQIRASYGGSSGDASLHVSAATSGQSFRVGPAGGTFSLFDGDLVMEFSPGSLSEDTEITVAPVEVAEAPPGWAPLDGTGYQFSPSGLQFNDPANAPVWLTMGFDPADLPAGAELYAAKIVGDRLLPLGERVMGGSSARSLITGFSVSGYFIWTCLCPPTVSRMEIMPQAVTFEPGETTHVLAEAFDFNDDVYNFDSGGPVVWTTSNSSIVEVNAVTSRRALIRGLSPGTATITGTLRGVSQQVNVTVTTRVARVEVTPATASAVRGGTQQFVATAYDRFDNVLSGPWFTPRWTSAHPCYAAVDENGLATGLNAGNATINAVIQGVSGSAGISVTDPDPVGSVPESLQGDWALCRKSNGQFLATLHLEHEPGATTVTGRVTMAPGATSVLSAGRWQDQIFSVNWTLMVQGGERTFGITGAEPVTANRLDGRYNDRVTLSTYDVLLVRQQGN